MFEHFKNYPWVLKTYRYTTIEHLLHTLKMYVIEPAEMKAQELEKHRMRGAIQVNRASHSVRSNQLAIMIHIQGTILSSVLMLFSSDSDVVISTTQTGH